MNVAMLFMIHVCVKVKNKNQIIRGPERLFTGLLYLIYILNTEGIILTLLNK